MPQLTFDLTAARPELQTLPVHRKCWCCLRYPSGQESCQPWQKLLRIFPRSEVCVRQQNLGSAAQISAVEIDARRRDGQPAGPPQSAGRAQAPSNFRIVSGNRPSDIKTYPAARSASPCRRSARFDPESIRTNRASTAACPSRQRDGRSAVPPQSHPERSSADTDPALNHLWRSRAARDGTNHGQILRPKRSSQIAVKPHAHQGLN